MRPKIPSISLPLFFLLVVIVSTIIFRVRLLNVPLERDEGEYAYIAQLMLDGTPPYLEAYNMKFPGIYFIYAGILYLFGETQTAIHFCLLLINIFTIVLVYMFARKVYDAWTAAAAACAFSLLSMSYHVQGFWANAEHFILPLIVGANIFLFNGIRKDRLTQFLYSGVLFGCAAVVKQQGAFFGLFGFIALLISFQQNKIFYKSGYWKKILFFIGGIVLPLLLTFFYLAYAGVLEKFYLWTFTYAKEYSSISGARDIKFNIIGSFFPIFRYSSPIWIIAGIGFIALLSVSRHRQFCALVLGMLIAGIAALSIGFYFMPHYFVLLLPAAAILFGVGARSIFNYFSNASMPIVRYFPPVFAIAITIAGTLAAHWDVLVQSTPIEATQTVYHSNPFPFTDLFAKIIREKTSKEDKIAIIGNEPQFLFHSQRRSATSFIYIYSITEDQPLSDQFRLEMIHQIESARPKLLIYTNLHPEWYRKNRSWTEIDKWFFSYAKMNYVPIVRFEYKNISDTLLITDPAALSKKPSRLFWISIYELQNK